MRRRFLIFGFFLVCNLASPVLLKPAEAFFYDAYKFVMSYLSLSKSYAVVVGIDSYEKISSLNYAVNDAEAMSKASDLLGLLSWSE